ncbi:hypothetical protein N3K66_006991 [Trichothecium roseum]|uniref:Uncharacterized protein n=1 Tax=Trichothecium roseum TaxID=47278 RepID=A0ACC0UWY1_9HYPO|nr:hypothetical protein N3K66_006991 [Trichothecium roseum]
MASPPSNAMSPTAMSPPAPASAQLPSKKRPANADTTPGPSSKRRKPSLAGSVSSNHPLRQTSFPPEARSSMARSPSVDATSHVSGSVASGVTAGGASKKRRGRKSKGTKLGDDAAAATTSAPGEKTPSLVGGKAPTAVSGQGGDKDGEEDEDDNAEMALEDVVARTQEQKAEEIRLRAMFFSVLDADQEKRYGNWRAAKLPDAVVKRVVNATVSQSVPQMVSTAVKAVTKLFAGEIIEHARQVQAEMIAAGEEQVPKPSPTTDTADTAATSAPPLAASQTNGVPPLPQLNGSGEASQTSFNGNGVAPSADASTADTQSQPITDATVSQDMVVDGNGEAPTSTEETVPDDKEEYIFNDGCGPLRPEHLREALKRYKLAGESRGVGVQQLWHAQHGSGVERFSTRTGKRLFK